MEEHKVLWWLSRLSWSTAERISAFSGLTVATVNKHLAEYYELGWVTSRMAGRGGRAQRIWILTSEALERFYCTGHKHRNGMGSDGHYHDVLDPEGADHQHVPWHLSQAGAKELYDRREQSQAFHEIALRLFPEAGEEWLAYVGGETPSLRLWVPIRHGQLVEHSAIYTNTRGDFEVVFCWLGRQLKPIRMMEKWPNRFSSLDHLFRDSAAVRSGDGSFGLIDHSSPGFDPTPQPSCYVMVGADLHIVRQAMKLISRWAYLREEAFSFWVAGNPCQKVGESGRVFPNADHIYELFEDVRAGEPEKVAPPTGNGNRDNPPAPAILPQVLPYRIMCLAEEWPAICEEDVEEPDAKDPGAVRKAFDALVEAGLLEKRNEVYYMTDAAMQWAAARDRISVLTIRNRNRSYLNKSGERHQHDLEHNRGTMEIFRIFRRNGIRVYGGWRGVQQIKGKTQIQPDGLAYIEGKDGPFLVLIEFERSATTPEEIRKKLRTYRKAAEEGIYFRVIWITETRRAASRFLQRAGTLDVLVTTMEELRRGPLRGPDSIWRGSFSSDL